MNEVKCPKCGAVFKIDEQNYDSILKQIRNHEFTKELENCQQQFEKDKKAAIEITKKELETIMNDRINTLNIEIINLKNELKNKNDMLRSLRQKIYENDSLNKDERQAIVSDIDDIIWGDRPKYLRRK